MKAFATYDGLGNITGIAIPAADVEDGQFDTVAVDLRRTRVVVPDEPQFNTDTGHRPRHRASAISRLRRS